MKSCKSTFLNYKCINVLLLKGAMQFDIVEVDCQDCFHPIDIASELASLVRILQRLVLVANLHLRDFVMVLSCFSEKL